MTRGKPVKILMIFMLPMLLGNIFQQLYNIVDTVIVDVYKRQFYFIMVSNY